MRWLLHLLVIGLVASGAEVAGSQTAVGGKPQALPVDDLSPQPPAASAGGLDATRQSFRMKIRFAPQTMSFGLAPYTMSSGLAPYTMSFGLAKYTTSSGLAPHAMSSGHASLIKSSGFAVVSSSSGPAP